MSEEKGITLITIVVTIIILLILSAITLTIIFNSSIIGKSQSAKLKTEISALEENLKHYSNEAKISNKKEYKQENLIWDGENEPQNTAKLTDGENEDNIEKILGKIPNDLQGKVTIGSGVLKFKNLTQTDKKVIEDMGYEVIEENQEEEENPNLVTFKAGSTTIDNLKISINTKGELTLNGTLTEGKYFIKLSDGIEVKKSNNVTTDVIFKDWIQNANTIATSGNNLIQEVEKISGDFNIGADGQLNSAIRTSDNTAILNCKLKENIYNIGTILKNDAKVSYLYIDKGTGSFSCNNLKLKVKVYSKTANVTEGTLNLQTESKDFNGFSCNISEDKKITLNGPVAKKTFLKITDGIDRKVDTMSDTQWVDNGNIIAKAGSKMRLVLEQFGGDFIANTKDSQFNCVLRNKSNQTIANIKLKDANFVDNKTYTNYELLEEDVTVCYLYFSNDIICNNYIFRPSIEIVE